MSDPSPRIPGRDRGTPTVSVVVATRNRADILRGSLVRMRAALGGLSAEILIVDDASDACYAETLVGEGLADRVVMMARNSGVDAFNAGAACARGRYLLVLDDDAWVDGSCLVSAVEELDRDATLGAVALHPRHPGTGASEWRFLGVGRPASRCWPLIGPGSLVRASAWRAVGGYERRYFLYGNDTDLALKLLGSGWGVFMRPDLAVWHDCTTASRRPMQWFRLAVRNRVWTARRHARGLPALGYAMASVLEAHWRARCDPRRHVSVMAGAALGLVRRPPGLPANVRRDGRGMVGLFAVRSGRDAVCAAERAAVPSAPEAVAAPLERVTAVVPSLGRHADVCLLLGDLARQRPAGVALDVVVVDNASSPPLETLTTPSGLSVRFVRLNENLGGSGGFNAGMRQAMHGGLRPDAVWLLDSDVRAGRGALRALVGALRDRPGLSAAGSAMLDPHGTGIYEVGGVVDRRSGHYRPAGSGRHRGTTLIDAEYLAATSLLVRASSIERVGLMPDAFLNGDDVEWTVRMARETGTRLFGVAGSVITHPRGQSPTLARYYQALNALRPARVAGLPIRVRVARVCIEAGRAFAMVVLGRGDLAGLHARGLHDCLRRRSARRPGSLRVRPDPGFGPAVAAFARAIGGSSGGAVRLHSRLRLTSQTSGALADALANAGLDALAERVRELRPGDSRRSGVSDAAAGLWRLCCGGQAGATIAPLDEHPSTWGCGRVVLVVWPGGAQLVRGRWRRRAVRGVLCGLWCLALGVGSALRPRRPEVLPRVRCQVGARGES